MISINRTIEDSKLGPFLPIVFLLLCAPALAQTAPTAQRLLSEGIKLAEDGQGSAIALHQGIEKLKRALELWRTAGDQLHQAETLNKLGEFYIILGNAKQALDYHTQALELYQGLSDQRGESTSLNRIGYALQALGETNKALTVYNQALPLKRLLADKKGEAHSLYGIGVAYLKSGGLQIALEHFEPALILARATDEKFLELSALSAIGTVYYMRANWRKALEYHRQALDIGRRSRNRRNQAFVLNIMGNDYFNLGELQTAKEYRIQALALCRMIGDRRCQAYTLNALAAIYSEWEDNKNALKYYDEALSLMEASGDKYALAYVLTGSGYLQQRLGNLDAARANFSRALDLNRATGDRSGESLSLRNLGRIFFARKDHRTAKEYLTEALTLARATGDQTRELSVLVCFANVEQDLNRLTDAIAYMEAALAIIESARQSITSQDLRASYITTNRDLYEFYIELLMQMHQQRPTEGFESLAFQASERARARSLLDTVTESLDDIRQGVDARLLEEQSSIWSQLRATSAQLTRIQNSTHRVQEENTATREVEALLRSAQDLDTRIRAASPRYAALTQPQILSVKDVQEQVLDDDTMLLEYSFAPERSYVWAVTKTSIKSFALPGRSEIESAARRVHELFALKADLVHPDATERLSAMLLKPVANELRKKRILIVGEGALQYIPFAALPDPNQTTSSAGQSNGSGGRRETPAPLILNHEIVTLPSASVLAALRRELSGRKPAPNALAILADPVFDRYDERVRADKQKTKNAVLQAHVTQSNSEFGSNNFQRLALSRTEAQQIVALLPEHDQQLEALDFAASRATATSAELRSYRIVHFATHSLLNNKHPELSGIVLSLVDETGRPQNGFLRLFDIYNMNLGAELVVLSACQTALGKDVTGEGLVGLTRGFMYAGAPRVVASLWKVSDKATSELMRRFYSNMFKERMHPAAALRAAQVSMLSEKQWAAPYDWAGFVIQGEWK